MTKYHTVVRHILMTPRCVWSKSPQISYSNKLNILSCILATVALLLSMILDAI